MDQTTFSDVLQKSFVAMSMGSSDQITTINILLNLTMSFLVGMFIFYIYKKTYQGVLYQRSFNISIVLASTVTAMIIMTISGNLILSLGMVGALSIVRFRTPVKDSIDLIFLFWAIAAGIANGVGYYNISIISSVMIAIFMFILTQRKDSIGNIFILVIQLKDAQNEKEVLAEIKAHTDKLIIKSKNISDIATEITMEIRVTENNTDFLNRLHQDNKISQATIVTYEQDLAAV